MTNDKSVQQVIVADIGGTNARFAVATLDAGSRPTAGPRLIEHYAGYSCADFHDPLSLIQTYIDDCPIKNITTACFAVAGPADGTKAYLTNLGWNFDAAKLTGALMLENVIVANDFAALARSVTALDPNKTIPLHQPASPPVPGPMSVMGPGTGFGAAQILQKNEKVTVISTESGHSAFVPTGAMETKIWNMIRASMGRITVETLLSGIGILRIYRAICSLNDLTPLNYEPSTISQLAMEENDPICVATLNVFCTMLGGVASDIAMTHGAVGGVFLGGGILPKIANFVQHSEIVKSYLDKPPMEKYVEQIPLNLIVDPEAALIGAALLAEDAISESP